MGSQPNSGEPNKQRSFARYIVLALLALGAVLAYRGYAFYRLDVAARVEHPDYRVLSPVGFVGHGYGMVGTLLMLTNLLYLVRRRFPHLPVGSMRTWLDIHVFTGLAGAMLVLFHSAFQVRNPVASASAYSVLLVVLTGIIGRNMVAFAPRADMDRLESALDVLDEYHPGIRRSLVSALQKHVVTTPNVSVTLLGALRLVPTWQRQGAERRELVLARVAVHGDAATLPVDDRARRALALDSVTSEAAREAYAVGARVVLDSWRGFHRFFAFLLVITVTLHVGVAWYFGFRWIFGRS